LAALRFFCLILYQVFGVATQFTGRKKRKPHLRYNHKNYNRHAIRFWSNSATLAILFWNWWRTYCVVQNTHRCLIIIKKTYRYGSHQSTCKHRHIVTSAHRTLWRCTEDCVKLEALRLF
jgi:hypothetical protein